MAEFDSAPPVPFLLIQLRVARALVGRAKINVVWGIFSFVSFRARLLSFEYQEVGAADDNQLIRKAENGKELYAMSAGVYCVGARHMCC